MRYLEFITEGKRYTGLSVARRVAERLGHKVVKDGNYLTTVDHDDPRPEIVPNPYREDIEPRLKEELKKLVQEKKRFLEIKAKVNAGFVRNRELEEEVSNEKWKELKKKLRDVRKQLKFLPARYKEIHRPQKTALERIERAIEENNWTLTESAFGVQFLTCPLYHKTIAALDPKEQIKLKSFIEFKKENPLRQFGGTDKSLGAQVGPFKGMKLQHAHVGRDALLVYSIEGKDPIKIKLYGVFKHDDLGVGQPPNKNKAASKAEVLSNQNFTPATSESVSRDKYSNRSNEMKSEEFLMEKKLKKKAAAKKPAPKKVKKQDDEWEDEEDVAPVDPDQDRVPHIIMQLRKALDVDGDYPVLFQDGSKHKIPKNVTKHFVQKYLTLKPADREAMQDMATKDLAGFKKALHAEFSPNPEQSIYDR